ncbi:MAG TPA: S8 family serine peptidase [Phototrophicaceae bacterium]|nr:S8 family serine peptidase [Phototrophicaceae bacterium]
MTRFHTPVLRQLRMWIIGLIAVVVLVASVPLFAQEIPLPQENGVAPTGKFTDTWAIQLAPGVSITTLTSRVGNQFVMPIGSLPNWYVIRVAGVNGWSPSVTNQLLTAPGVMQAIQQVEVIRSTRAPTDPLFPNQWHLNNTGQAGGIAGNDANVIAAWDAGYTGVDQVVASVDDGVWIAHPDLVPNVRTDLSYDFLQNDDNPSAGGHGTSVAGVMAAAANEAPNDANDCGVGAAYSAGIAGLRILGSGETDAVEAAGLTHRGNDIFVYNNSWGPSDDGGTLEGPGPLVTAGFIYATTYGRGGLGSIYTWAAGNGGNNDNINADGYANSIYVISVGASTNLGERSGYSEPGSSMLVTSPSNGGSAGITTTAGSSTGCTSSFGGTSSASPLAAGVIALMLDANPTLTWRDVQTILVHTSEKIDPTDPDWQDNGAGFHFNHNYGFGRVDAGAAVAAAETWVNVPPMTNYVSSTVTVSGSIPEDAGSPLTSTINVPDDFIVEHAEIVVNATHPRRGQININLTSPEGTVSRMIFGRSDTGANYNNWHMTSVANWGEGTAGDWTLSVWDANNDANDGTFNSWSIILWGYSESAAPTSTGVPVANTPTPTPTAGTPEPTFTPTATPTDVPGTELLANGGFETDLDGWTAKNLTKDKVVTDKPEKIVAHSGTKAFRFKGGVGENSKLQQKISGDGGDADDVYFTAWVKTGIDGVGTIAIAKIVYADDTREKLELTLDAASPDYQVLSDTTTLTGAVTKIKVQIKFKGTSGKLFIDDVSLIQSIAGLNSNSSFNRAVPLP